MKVYFKDLTNSFYKLDIDEKNTTIPSVIELLRNQIEFPNDKSANFLYAGGFIKTDTHLKKNLSQAAGSESYFNENDPIHLIFINKVTSSNSEQTISKQEPIKIDLMGVLYPKLKIVQMQKAPSSNFYFLPP